MAGFDPDKFLRDRGVKPKGEDKPKAAEPLRSPPPEPEPEPPPRELEHKRKPQTRRR